jgi:phosphate transport system protein
MTSRLVFQNEMEKLNQEVARMAGLANQAIEAAVRCIVDKDARLKPEVERLDREIYSLEQVIERHCLDLIALHTPVASDLRTVSTCLKIITDLNRIGRYARDIVESFEVLANSNGFARMVSIEHMAELVVGMVTDATQSFIKRDAESARQLFERDDEVDSLYDTNFRAVVTYMIEDPRKITAGTHIILVSRYLERIADHSCNIGERVWFMVTGERLDLKDRKKNRKSYDLDPLPRPEYSTSTHELEEK